VYGGCLPKQRVREEKTTDLLLSLFVRRTAIVLQKCYVHHPNKPLIKEYGSLVVHPRWGSDDRHTISSRARLNNQLLRQASR
jgi:hypothetical protein